jgi:ABC-2 type transport system ATP-binding protein
MDAIRLVRIAKSLDHTRVLADISMTVQRGEVMGVVGQPGSGKTTLLRIASGLLPPDRGQVIVDGRIASNVLRGRLAYVSDSGQLLSGMSLERSLLAWARERGMARAAAASRVEDLLGTFDLADKRHRWVEALSRGERHRARLLAALLPEPAVLILDDPFGAMDRAHALALVAVLREMAGRGVAILLASHQIDMAAAACDRVTVLAFGTVVGRLCIEGLSDGARGSEVRVRPDKQVTALVPRRGLEPDRDEWRLVLEYGVEPEEMRRLLMWQGIRADRCERVSPRLEEIVEQMVVTVDPRRAGDDRQWDRGPQTVRAFPSKPPLSHAEGLRRPEGHTAIRPARGIGDRGEG